MADEDTLDSVDAPTNLPPTTEEDIEDFYDIAAQRLYEYESYEELDRDQRTDIRNFTTQFFQFANGIDGLTRTLEAEGFYGLPPETQAFIRRLIGPNTQDMESTDYWVLEYTRILHYGDAWLSVASNSQRYVELRGLKINSFLEQAHAEMLAGEEADSPQTTDPTDLLAIQLATFGDFEPNLKYLEIKRKFQEEMLDRPGKFRQDSAPASVAPWQMRIGGSTFLVPPLNISVTQEFHTTSLTGGAIRQATSPKIRTSLSL
jgi:hypothetical protein